MKQLIDPDENIIKKPVRMTCRTNLVIEIFIIEFNKKILVSKATIELSLIHI